jgi:biopolymer transport protein ExbD
MQSTPGSSLEHDEDEGGLFAEINITPLTDVFLVLLIILMVVSTSVIEEEKEEAYEKGLLAERALQVMTPTSGADSDLVPEDVVISVLPDRTVFIENDEVPISELNARLDAIRAENPLTRIVLRGDVSASYEIVMDVIARCNQSGLSNIALATRVSAE